MKCQYQTNIDCRYVNTLTMTQTIPCIECELYEDGVFSTGGCLKQSVAIATIILIIMLIL